ncbi:LuxR family transcriptional regulator [Phycicoccus sp. MQZ13P-5]|uniref:LuxR family transcriptional regulator n=2 Tax=Phycicoccus sonneratiae TaxID=2807628 RepID=A0ABS2CKW8_9MICO|nr:LuxR family transcriptional regulator [Phycicoccus sonneraticus]
MFTARQLAHADPAGTDPWVAWLGVWPVPLALGLTTLAVLWFPDGRLPSRGWRPVLVAAAVLTAVSCLLSALWPVGYAAAGVSVPHPLADGSPEAVTTLWRVVATPSFVALQLLWVPALVTRWRTGRSGRELGWLLSAVAVAAVALAVGLLVAGSPRAGLLAACSVPLAAGLAVVHGRQTAVRSALSWLSRSGPDAGRLPADLAEAVARALAADGARVWIGSEGVLRVAGAWPEADPTPDASSLPALAAGPGAGVHPVLRDGRVTGALEVVRAAPLSRSEGRLLAELASQAALVVEHVSLAALIDGQRRAGHLDSLTPRERQVLELIARGMSNAAICAELHLSIKTVEPLVGAVFTKLGLHADSASNRRVLAALEYLRAGS